MFFGGCPTGNCLIENVVPLRLVRHGFVTHLFRVLAFLTSSCWVSKAHRAISVTKWDNFFPSRIPGYIFYHFLLSAFACSQVKSEVSGVNKHALASHFHVICGGTTFSLALANSFATFPSADTNVT